MPENCKTKLGLDNKRSRDYTLSELQNLRACRKEGKEKLKKGVKTLFQGAKKKLKKVGEDVGGVITGDKKINVIDNNKNKS